MALNFPNNPNDGDTSQQPNGVTYKWNDAFTRWEIIEDGSGLHVISTGMVAAFAIGTADAAWLLCDGRAVSRTTYAVLFGALGVIYGNGDGSTTFNLPDYRGNFLRGQDLGRGQDPDAASRIDRGDGTTGDAVGTGQVDDFRSHTHGNSNIRGPQGGVVGGVSNTAPAGTQDGGGISLTDPTGGSETRPVNIYVQYFIYSGLNLVAGLDQQTFFAVAKIANTGTIDSDSGHWSAADGGTGLINVTWLTEQIDALYTIQLTAESGAGRICSVVSRATTGFVISGFSADGSATNVNFHVIVSRFGTPFLKP